MADTTLPASLSSSAASIVSHNTSPDADSSMCRFSDQPFQPPLDTAAWACWLANYQRGFWQGSSPDTSVASLTDATTPKAESSYAQAFRQAHMHDFGNRIRCPKKDQIVRCEDGTYMDSFDFYKRNGWLAPPQLPRQMRTRCSAALQRHHVTEPHERTALNLYIKHAKAVFKADYSSFMVAGPDGTDMLVLAQDGGKAEIQKITRASTLCAHAMLLGQDELLVVNDTAKDWRFSSCPSTNLGTPCSASGNAMRFYASAPLYLSYNLDGLEGVVQVGRLCIMANEPREFNSEDGDLLLTIARMASDALEREFQSRRSGRVVEMQRRTARLIRSMEDPKVLAHPKPSDLASTAASSEASEAVGLMRYSTAVMEMACEEVRSMLGAAAVAAIDISGFRLKRSSGHSLSPKSSAYPMTPWQTTEPKDLAGPLTPPAELGGQSAPIPPGSPVSVSPKATRNPVLRARSSFLDDVELNEHGVHPQILAFSGNETYMPQLHGSSQIRSMCEHIGRIIREDKMAIRSKLYRLAPESPSSDDDSEMDGLGRQAPKPLIPVLPADAPVTQYALAASFVVESSRPLFLCIAMFDRDRLMEDSEHLFLESCVQISTGSIIRQRASDVDVIQAEFLRHVQHNLRTPLHGALGAVEYLRGAISNDDEEDGKIDLSADGVLATLLDSIALSGSTLNTYIDDLLSFQNLAGLKSGGIRPGKSVSTDLVKLVEEVCHEEWEFGQRLEMQSQRLDLDILGSGGPLTGMELIVKASPSAADFEWMVDAKALKQAVRKVVSNAIRFTRHGYVEVTLRAGKHDTNSFGPIPVEIEIQDTGIGMTREFCAEQLTKPFTKGDSFRDGIGLGMTIVSSTIQNMGGKLLVASEVNVGTRVTMTVPMVCSGRSRYASDGATSASPFAVKKIAYIDMETRGLRRLANSICEHLSQRGGLELIHDLRQADCVFVPESSLSRMDPNGTGPLFMSMIRNDARIVVLANTPLSRKPDGLEWLQNRATMPFPVPHGPSSLRLLDGFLRETQPLIIRDAGYINRSRRSKMRSSISDASSFQHPSRSNSETEPKSPPVSDPAPAPTPAGAAPEVVSDGKRVGPVPVPKSNGAAPKKVQAKTDGGPLNKDEFRVLVVEDNPINMKLLTTLLQRLNIKYDEAHDGAEAVSKFVSFQPAVVLLDISLPIQDGFEACTQMRKHNHPSHIVAITALSSEQDKQRGMEVCGMNAWMTKPVSTRQLKQDLMVWRKSWDERLSPEATMAFAT